MSWRIGYTDDQLRRMTIRRINALNIFLIGLSALCAFRFPLETFLGAYAILGPLHYLTEISWLEQRQYFLPSKRWAWMLAALTLVVFPVAYLIPDAPWIVVGAVLLAFFGSLLVSRERQRWVVAAAIAGIGVLFAAFFVSPFAAAILTAFIILLPSIIHVSVFTGTFMLAGALREKGRSGLLAFGVFLLCSVGLVFSGAFFPDWNVSRTLLPLYQRFVGMQTILVQGIGTQGADTATLFYSPLGLGVMRFIGFAYLYHYLNWFSKTSIIQWHAVSKKRAGLIIVSWIATVVLYGVNYQIGLLALLFLSLLHVFLEFPLNWKTLAQISRLS